MDAQERTSRPPNLACRAGDIHVKVCFIANDWQTGMLPVGDFGGPDGVVAAGLCVSAGLSLLQVQTEWHLPQGSIKLHEKSSLCQHDSTGSMSHGATQHGVSRPLGAC